jgi:hypothetical protein
MRSEESSNLKGFLRRLGVQTDLEKDAVEWEIPALQQLNLAINVLNSALGESTKRAVARSALDNYAQLDDRDKADFFTHLLSDYGVDASEVKLAFEQWQQSEGAAELVALSRQVEPQRQGLLRSLNYAPDGTLDLVSMRADLLRLIRDGHEQLKPLDYDFKHVLSSWFNPGFLDLSELTWDKAKAVKDHLLRYESVHPMKDGTALKRRVQPKDRKIYGFTHPATGDKPLIFVEVAFTNGLPSGIDEILEQHQSVNPSKADTAIFYSINSAFDGLAGISFGNFLIKRVTELIQATMPNICVFATFSPIPKLRNWLLASRDSRHKELVNELEAVPDLRGVAKEAALANEMVTATSHYITHAKNHRGLPADPVARFHLGNGATAWKVVWPASERDYIWQASYGAMIIYRYEPEKIETQHEEFVQEQKIAVGPQFFDQYSGATLSASDVTQSEVHVD